MCKYLGIFIVSIADIGLYLENYTILDGVSFSLHYSMFESSTYSRWILELAATSKYKQTIRVGMKEKV